MKRTLCGSGNEEHDAYHVISVFVAENQITLGEMEAENKKSEIKMIPKVLELVEVEGDIVTIDAAGCYKPTVEKIVEKKADYVIGCFLIFNMVPGLFKRILSGF